MSKRLISAIECRGGPKYSHPLEVRWCDPSLLDMKISHELLAEVPTLPDQLPWGMSEVEQDEEGVYFRRSLDVSGQWERANEVHL